MQYIRPILPLCRQYSNSYFKYLHNAQYKYYSSTGTGIYSNKYNNKLNPNKFLTLKSFNREFNYKRQARNGKIEYSFYVILIIPGAFFLGAIWKYKKSQISKLMEEDAFLKMKIPAINLPQRLQELEDLEYRTVKLKGTFMHKGEVILGPIHLIQPVSYTSEEEYIKPKITNQSGYQIITPFMLSNSDLVVLVNRGWVPKVKKDPSTRIEGQVEGQVTFTGIVRTTAHSLAWIGHPKNVPHFYYRDVEAMSKFSGTLPLYFEAVESFKGGPLGSQMQFPIDKLANFVIFCLSSMGMASLWFVLMF